MEIKECFELFGFNTFLTSCLIILIEINYMLMLKNKISYINNKHVIIFLTITIKITITNFIKLCSYEKKITLLHMGKKKLVFLEFKIQ